MGAFESVGKWDAIRPHLGEPGEKGFLEWTVKVERDSARAGEPQRCARREVHFAAFDWPAQTQRAIAQGVRIGPGQQTGSGSIGQRGAGGGVPGGGY